MCNSSYLQFQYAKIGLKIICILSNLHINISLQGTKVFWIIPEVKQTNTFEIIYKYICKSKLAWKQELISQK